MVKPLQVAIQLELPSKRPKQAGEAETESSGDERPIKKKKTDSLSSPKLKQVSSKLEDQVFEAFRS